jgi:hypothetical protein
MTQMKSEEDGQFITAKFGRSKLFPGVKSKNLVLLSIKGNAKCTGDHLGAIITRAVTNNPNKESTTFLIVDEIQWHNLKNAVISYEEEIQLKEKAIQLGLDYFESQLQYFLSPINLDVSRFNQLYPNKNAFEKLQIINDISKKEAKGFEILFWRDWDGRAPAIFKQNKTKLLEWYYTEEFLKKPLKESAVKFAESHSEQGDRDILILRSEGFLREESLDVMWLAAYHGYNFVTYAGSMRPPLKATKMFFIKNSKDKSTIGDDKYSALYLYSDNPEQLVNWQEVSFSLVNKAPVIEQPVVQALVIEQPAIQAPVIQGNKNQFFIPLNKSLKENKTFSIDPQMIKELGLLILQADIDHKGVVLAEFAFTISSLTKDSANNEYMAKFV